MKTRIYAMEYSRGCLLEKAAILKRSHVLEDGTWEDSDAQLEHCECLINSFLLFDHINSLRAADSILNPTDAVQAAENN